MIFHNIMLKKIDSNILYCVTATITRECNFPKELTLKDILGEELNNYYDGWGFNMANNTRKYFFYDVPKHIAEIIPSRAEKYHGLNVTIDPMINDSDGDQE